MKGVLSRRITECNDFFRKELVKLGILTSQLLSSVADSIFSSGGKILGVSKLVMEISNAVPQTPFYIRSNYLFL